MCLPTSTSSVWPCHLPVAADRQVHMSAATDITGQVWPLLGLPFHPCRMQDAVALIHQAIDSRQDLFISTPNLNFAMAALDDPGFRQSVLNSGLSIADGMPLVW